jgi:DNA-binding transcriptional LysR family regulator
MNFDIGLKKLRFEDLNAFKILSETKNYIRAAEILKKTQGSMSTEINKIEEVFGVKLINRSSRNFELTESGTLLLDFISKTFQEFKKLSDQITSLQMDQTSQLSGTIRISSSTIPGEYIIPSIITEFKSKNPSVEFITHLKNSGEAVSDLKNKQAEIAAVGTQIPSKDQHEYEIIEVGHDELYFIVSSNHELIKSRRGRESISLKDLYQYPFILREEGSGTRKAFQTSKYFKPNIQIGLILNSSQSILTALRNSNYVTVLSSYSLHAISNQKIEKTDFINAEKLNEKLNPDYQIIVPIDYKGITRRFYLVHSKSAPENKLSKSFWEYCKNFDSF